MPLLTGVTQLIEEEMSCQTPHKHDRKMFTTDTQTKRYNINTIVQMGRDLLLPLDFYVFD